VTAGKLHKGLVTALIGIMHDPYGLRPNRIPNAVEPGDQDEPTRDPLALRSNLLPPSTNQNIMRTFCSFPQEVASMLFFEFPEDARWNDDHDAVEFSVILRPYEGTARISRRVFQGLLDQRPTPERCIEAFHLQRTRFEMVAERKLRRRQLTDDGNVEITGRDLREKTPPVGQGSLFDAALRGMG
jgi:hypothetical protein